MMSSAAIFIAPYALDKVVTVFCREGLSVIEMDHWWLEMSLDYGIELTACNDNPVVVGPRSNQTAHR